MPPILTQIVQSRAKALWLFIREQTSHTTKEQYVAVIALSVHHRGPAPRLS
jgi:hypothetical protein